MDVRKAMNPNKNFKCNRKEKKNVKIRISKDQELIQSGSILYRQYHTTKWSIIKQKWQTESADLSQKDGDLSN